MEQKPIEGQDALVPPDPETARRYLETVEAVVDRRDRAVDRRALARLQIGNAVVMAAFFVAFALVLRQDDVLASQIMLFILLVWGQLSTGMAQRTGMQWRMTRSRWPLLVGGAMIVIGAFVVFGFAALDTRLPVGVVLIPAAIVLVGVGGHGVVQLIRAAGDPRRPRPAPRPLPRRLRWGTVLVGVAFAVLTVLAGSPDDVLRSVITLLVMLCLVAWIAASASDLGLPAVGASWRWPHLTVFFVAACIPVGIVLGSGVLDNAGLAGMCAGVGVTASFVAVSFVAGHGERA